MALRFDGGAIGSLRRVLGSALAGSVAPIKLAQIPERHESFSSAITMTGPPVMNFTREPKKGLSFMLGVEPLGLGFG